MGGRTVGGERRELAAWLISQRREIEKRMIARLGPAAPSVSGPESEALRRFRSFAATALLRDHTPPPALDGLRVNDRRVMALLEAWTTAAEEEFRGRDGDVREALEPLIAEFRLSLRTTSTGRRSHGAPRASRRAVVAAIDRVTDAFLAIDADDGKIADANPAAGSLLGLHRDALLGVDAISFVPESARVDWWTHLDAVAEGDETRLFPTSLVDRAGLPVEVEASMTRFATRSRTLALVVARSRRL